MGRLEAELYERHLQAGTQRVRVSWALTERAEDCEDVSEILPAYAADIAFASWWDDVIALIEDEDEDEDARPEDAIRCVREIARQVVIDQPLARSGCPFAQGFATARYEAARRFYRETRDLEAQIPLSQARPETTPVR